MRWCILLACLTVGCLAEWTRYDGYQQWFVTPRNRQQLDLLRSLDREEVIFFNELPRRLGERVEMLIHPTRVKQFAKELGSLGARLGNPNIQNYLDVEFARLAAKQRDFHVYDPQDYNTLDDINTELSRLAADSCPTGKTCSVESIGQSVEGRDINKLSITSAEAHDDVVLDSLIHAREWLAGATLMRIAAQLMNESDSEASHILEHYNFHIIPVMNPDGYEYSWTNDRFWRKSRNENAGSSCIGTDLNRNYPVYWNAGSGSSDSPCSDVYHGSEAASEPETQAVMDFASTVPDPLVWITIHTAAQFLLLPYGGTSNTQCNYPADYDDQLQAANAAVAAMEAIGGLDWTADNACDGFYNADGITMDWTYDPVDGAGFKYSYTPELRGPGFDPDASFIPISFQENWAGLIALLEEIEVIEGHDDH